jgi:hypothetical protein
MRSIERRFKKIEKENPNLSTFIVFSRAVAGQHFSKDRLSRWFNKLVDKDDYDKKDKKTILEYLMGQIDS